MEMVKRQAQRHVCVFCGSSDGSRVVYRKAASALGRALAEAGLGVVYGGAHVGLMGALADEALAAGGSVIGVIPKKLEKRELAHRNLTELHVVDTMHQRKAKMADRADAFVALPGGLGTLDEFFEVLTWAQLGIHSKPCLLLNTDGYFDDLLRFLDVAQDQHFIQRSKSPRIVLATEPEEIVPILQRRWEKSGKESKAAENAPEP